MAKSPMAKSDVVKTDGEKPERARTSPLKFFQQVRQEVSKVTWPSRKETTITTIMVFIMVALAALFFFVVDQALGFVVRVVLGIGG